MLKAVHAMESCKEFEAKVLSGELKEMELKDAANAVRDEYAEP